MIFATPIRSSETTFFVGHVDKRRIPVITKCPDKSGPLHNRLPRPAGSQWPTYAILLR